MNKMKQSEIDSIMKNISPLIHIEDDIYREKFKQVVVNGIYTPYIISTHGRIFNSNFHGKKGNLRQMKTKIDKDGYEVLKIYINGKQKDAKIHRLVANAFIVNPKNKPEVNHIKGKEKLNNGIWNLEWSTSKENSTHAVKTGLRVSLKGEDVYCSKYMEDDIINICNLLLQNKSFKYIQKEINVPNHMIHHILRKKRWKHITSNYDFSDYCFGKDVDKIKEVCELLESNKYTQMEISNITGLNVKIVNNILSGHSYKNISKQYKLSNFNKYKYKKV